MFTPEQRSRGLSGWGLPRERRAREPLPRGLLLGSLLAFPPGSWPSLPISHSQRFEVAGLLSRLGTPVHVVGGSPESYRPSAPPDALPRVCLCPHNRFPFYFELKIAFVIWLLSPYTKGSSVLYRKFVHPTLSNKEKVCSHSASPRPPQAKAAQRPQLRPCPALPEPEVAWQGPSLLPQAGPGHGGQPSPPPCSPPSDLSGDRRVHQPGPRQEL